MDDDLERGVAAQCYRLGKQIRYRQGYADGIRGSGKADGWIPVDPTLRRCGRVPDLDRDLSANGL